jgi:hypothetical protein
MRMIAANALTATNALTAAILPAPISQPFIAAPAFPVPPQPGERQRYSLVRVYRLLGVGASVGWPHRFRRAERATRWHATVRWLTISAAGAVLAGGPSEPPAPSADAIQ